MSQSTDELLDALKNIDTAEEPPTSQADHLMNALQSRSPDAASEPTSSVEHTHTASPEEDFESLDDLLSQFEKASTQTSQPDSPIQTEEQRQPNAHKNAQTKTIDALALALEATKAAQEAAENSQKSAELALENAHNLKAQTVELSDANFSWRQAVRTATHEIKSAKNSVTLLTTITLIFMLITSGAMGYTLYNLNQKYTALKTNIQDILQTQNGLFQNKISAKVDELASLVEYLSSEVKTLKSDASLAISPPAPIKIHAETPSNMTLEPEHTVQTPPSHGEVAVLAEKPASTSTANDLEKLSKLVQTILEKQHHLETLITRSSTAPNAKVIAQLTPEEQKLLKTIRWLASEQRKQLQKIETYLKTNTSNKTQHSNMKEIRHVLETLQKQVQTLQAEQSLLRKEVQSLKTETKKLSLDRPYFYRAPKDQ